VRLCPESAPCGAGGDPGVWSSRGSTRCPQGCGSDAGFHRAITTQLAASTARDLWPHVGAFGRAQIGFRRNPNTSWNWDTTCSRYAPATPDQPALYSPTSAARLRAAFRSRSNPHDLTPQLAHPDTSDVASQATVSGHLFAPVIRAILTISVMCPACGRRRRGWQRSSIRDRRSLITKRGSRDAGRMDKRQLADFLRSRRTRLQPADVVAGRIAAAHIRPAPGGGRAAGRDLSVNYYTRLEQARGPHPSRQVLGGADRRSGFPSAHLYNLAGEPRGRRPGRPATSGRASGIW
jgi:hypothetical protein